MVSGTDAVVSLHSQEPGLAPEELRIAVGGLNPANVAEAIAELRPWAQKSVPDVEEAPGQKDAVKARGPVCGAREASTRRNDWN